MNGASVTVMANDEKNSESPKSSRENSFTPRVDVRSYSLGARGGSGDKNTEEKRLASFSLEIAMLSTMSRKIETLSSMPKQLEALSHVPKQLEALSKSMNIMHKELAELATNTSPTCSDCEYKIRIDDGPLTPLPEDNFKDAPFSHQAYSYKSRRVSNASTGGRRISTTSLFSGGRRISSVSGMSVDRRQSTTSVTSGFSASTTGQAFLGATMRSLHGDQLSPKRNDGNLVWRPPPLSAPAHSASFASSASSGPGIRPGPEEGLLYGDGVGSADLARAGSQDLARAGVGSLQMSSIREKEADAQNSLELNAAGSNRSKHSADAIKIQKCMSFASLGGGESDFSKPQIWELASTHDSRLPRWILLPHSGWRLLWDVVIVINTLFAAFTIPLGLGYYRGCGDDHELNLLRDLGRALCWLDLVWIADIVINFRTGFFHLGRLQLQPMMIASWYARRWLIVDLLAAWPLVLAQVNQASCWTFWVGYSCKLLRLLRMGPSISRLAGHYRRKTSVKVIVYIACFTHVTACVWRLAQRADNMYEDPSLSVPQLYVQDAYWVIMTMTTVGYGDISPGGTFTYLYAIFVMCIASLFFGTTISALTHVTRALFHDEVENRVASVTQYMKRRHLPRELQRRVALNLRRRIHQNNQTTMDPTILSLLSPAMQRELLLSLLSTTVLEFPLFKGAQHSFVAEIAQAHTWLNCSPTDLVVAAGQLMQDVLFVISGSLVGKRGPARRHSEEGCSTIISNGTSGTDHANYSSHENQVEQAALSYHSERSQGLPDALLSPSSSFRGSTFSAGTSAWPTGREREYGVGAWYGEACLFDNDLVHHTTMISMCDSELAVLAQKDYFTIINKYPRLLERHRYFQKSLRDGTLNIDLLAYKPEKHRASVNEKQMSFWAGSNWSMRSPMSWTASLLKSTRGSRVMDFNDVVFASRGEEASGK